MLFRAEDGILKKRSGATAIFVAGHDQHGFARAYLAHGSTDLGHGGLARGIGKVFLQVGVLDPRRAARSERIGNPQNDVAPALAGVEDAGAISEAAGGVAKLAELAILEIQDLHVIDGFRNFLPVGADILHGSAAGAARDSAEALDA